MIRKRFLFTGRVQHVGFRWRARKASNMFHCTGWCRNNPDGSVTMELQGTRIQIDLVILAIRACKRIRIRNMITTLQEPIPEESDFTPVY